ncbi:ABC transporter ATP-binding protein [Candidatus Terasakiella magnetica]|uniref:ABC transporter ATP-binding protein n=1 Tax=Candidatus Terasakiella magnetica TaxID=1867952 RepID=UPI0023E35E41|nr:ATP-binding cassette domain-containing protein [Candidatus Terasakiella magnetica]
MSPGQCISVSGASGMGKSLFLKGIADLVINRADMSLDGEARIDYSAPDWRRRVTYVGAKPTWWYDKVVEHFEDKDWLAEVLPLVDLPLKVMGWNVSRLSSGESQRLALLRALEGTDGQEQRYFLLDEPTSALDGGRQAMVEDLLMRYLKAEHIAILFVSHDDRQVDRFAQKRWEIFNRQVREVPA